MGEEASSLQLVSFPKQNSKGSVAFSVPPIASATIPFGLERAENAVLIGVSDL